MEKEAASYEHAGFALRLGAFTIDSIIFIIGISILAALLKLVGLSLVPDFAGLSIDEMMEVYKTGSPQMQAYNFTLTGLNILYHSYFESQEKMASPGKQLLGIIVINQTGEGLSLFQAVLRNAGKLVSQMILMIGYFMCIFTQHRQCLHDILIKSYVIRNTKSKAE